MWTRRSWRCGAVTIAGLACLLVTATVALGWTISPKTSPAVGSGQAQVYAIAVGCHPTYDRFVIRAKFGTPGYDVRYVPQVIHDGSGLPVPLLGTRKLHVVLRPARAHPTGGTTLIPAVLTPLCSNLRQVKASGDFEGVVSFGIGLAHQAGFTVFRLTAPTRIVIDVAH